MKRTPALQPLSRDHHQALFVAQKLRRASAATASEAQGAFLGFWRSHGRHHFRCEEEVLLPAYAGYGDPRHPLMLRVLADHVRLEERELFPLIEQALPAPEIERVAAALAEAEGTSGR